MYGGSATVRTIQTVFSAEDRASAKLEAAEQRGDDLANQMEQTEQRLGTVTQTMAITGTAAVGLGAGIAALTARFSRLNQQFATIQTTSGAPAEQMNQIREAAKGVSTDLPVSLFQSVEAMKQLSFAGLSASESMAALSETSQLAVASNLQAGQAAQTVARSLNAFNLEAEQTDAIVGALGQTFSSSATNISRLSQGLTEVQATANAAGLSVAETTASLGLLSSSGLAGSKAGTSLNAVLRRLTSNSGETQEALSQLNLSMQDFTNASGELRGVAPIMSTISSRMQNVSSEAERIRIAQQLVGAEGARALLPLIDKTGQLSSLVENNLRAELQGAIGDIEEMQGAELSQTGQALGMQDLSGDTGTTELIANLQQLNEQGESTAQIASRLRVGLGVTSDAAELLAEDITKTNKSASELAEGINDVTTASALAEAQTKTLSGQITQLRSDLEVIGYQMQQGTKPAVMGVVSGLRTMTTPLAQNEAASRALGAGLVAATGAMGVATLGLGALAVNLKLAQFQQARLLQSTATYTALTKASAAATLAKNKAIWLATASSGALATRTVGLIGTLSGEIAAQYASATAAVSNATAMGILTGATTAASGALATFWSLLGPIGWAVLGVAAAGAALVAIWQGDLLGAGEEAGAVLGWFGDQAAMAWAIAEQGLGILYELTRIGATVAGLSLVAPFAALLKLPELPGMIRGVAPEVKQAAAQLPAEVIAGLNSMGRWKYLVPVAGPLFGLHDLITGFGPEARAAAAQLPAEIIAGLNSMGRWKYLVPILGPLMFARNVLTNPNEWRDAGAEIPHAIAAGVADAADAPVEAVAGVTGDIRSFLPFSPAKRGPLATLDSSGEALVTTLAEGVESNQGQLTSALETTLGATPLGVAGGAAIEVAGDAAESVSNGRTIDITINNEIAVDGDGTVTGEVERAANRGTTDALNSELEQFLRRLSRES